jgi:hypothetical protein
VLAATREPPFRVSLACAQHAVGRDDILTFPSAASNGSGCCQVRVDES